MLEMKINGLEKWMAEARVLDASQLDTSSVTVMSIVTIKNVRNNAEMTYKLVAESEADLKNKKISVSSPMGQGLLGKAVGEIAEVKTPNGAIQFEIIKIAV